MLSRKFVPLALILACSSCAPKGSSTQPTTCCTTGPTTKSAAPMKSVAPMKSAEPMGHMDHMGGMSGMGAEKAMPTTAPKSVPAVAIGVPTSLPAMAPETPEERNQRMAWWREARFGMFIHWGVYSVPAGVYKDKPVPGIGEWIMNSASIPVAEYAEYTKQFDPEKFDADKWVSIAKAAGMKYIVITSKHHDGFAMFKSAASDFNIVDATPFHRDPLKELAAACRRQGIKLGFYYSQNQDWSHAGGRAFPTGGRKSAHWDPAAQDGDFNEYLHKIAVPQVREILTNYGDVAVLWWDTSGGITKAQASELHDVLALQPKIITNNRLGGGFSGDTETPEQTIPATGYANGRDWETCMTINDTWGYKSTDTNFKSYTLLLRNLIDIASKGGNYLLNVGPTSEGEIPQPEVDRLKDIGSWLDANGEAIYGTTASPFPDRPTWGRATQKDGKLFLHVFHWPTNGKLFVPITSPVDRVHLLSSWGSLKVEKFAQGITIDVPKVAPDPAATVIVVEHKAPLVVGPGPVAVQAGDGGIVLEPYTATIVGKGPRVAEDADTVVSGWNATKASVEWTLAVAKPGKFKVRVTYATPADVGASEATFTVGGASATGTLAATPSPDAYRTEDFGVISVPAGIQTFKLQAKKVVSHGTLYLRDVTLVPAK